MTIRLRTGAGGIIAAIAFVVALCAQTGVRAEQGGASSGFRVTCDNPEIVARFVASAYPDDLVLLQRAVRSGVCRYADRGLPVEPVRFVAQVTANAQAAERFGYIWALRLPGQAITYGYFWRSEHDAMR